MVNSRKILLLSMLIIFSVIALYGAVSDYLNDSKNIKNIELVQNKLTQLTYIDEIITQLQKERGLSSIYYYNKSAKYKFALNEQKKETDVFIKVASKHIDTVLLNAKRQEAIKIINTTNAPSLKAFRNYTDIIKTLLYQSEMLILKTKNSEIKNSLYYYNHLNIMQETAGQIRGLISGILATKTISDQEYNEIIILKRKFQNHSKSVKGNIQLPLLFEQGSIKVTNQIIDKLIKDKDINMEPLKWFDTASYSVNTIRKSTIEELKHINTIVSNSMDEANNVAMRHFILWVIGSILLLVILIIAIILSKKLNSEQKLLKNYKDVIDNNQNSIVSKTDKFGRITYVNDTFCRVSKYKREELIGQHHNIIRHEDSPKEAFADLWKTIESGKTWNGIVKNRCKDGDVYWVHASISPIYDDKGNLVEYIALRHNITEMVLQSEEIERTQRELVYRMGEAVESRSKETGNHIRRVAHYSKLLAGLAGLTPEDTEIVFTASTMHDIGKIAIPDNVLLKPTKLDTYEYNIMQTHTKIGYKLLSGSNLPILKMAATIAYEHHEHYNGKGYPLGISANNIAMPSKIVALVDVFDALTSDRVYKKAWDLEKIVHFFREEAGQQFDPVLVELFLDNMEKFVEIKEQFKDV